MTVWSILGSSKSLKNTIASVVKPNLVLIDSSEVNANACFSSSEATANNALAASESNDENTPIIANEFFSWKVVNSSRFVNVVVTGPPRLLAHAIISAAWRPPL